MPSMTKRAKAWSRKAAPPTTRAAPAIRIARGESFISQPVSSQGRTPATAPGTRTRKVTVPAAAVALRDRCRLSRKASDQLGEALGLILRDERVGVVDLLQCCALDRLRQPLREGELEEAVLDGPGEHRRAIEGAELLGGLEGVLRVDPAQDLRRVAPNVPIREEGVDPL